MTLKFGVGYLVIREFVHQIYGAQKAVWSLVEYESFPEVLRSMYTSL